MPRDPGDIVRELYRRWNAGDPGWDLCAADVEWDVSRWAPDLPGVARGHDESRQLLRSYTGMWEELRFEPERLIEHGDQAVVAVAVHARGKGSGVPVSVRVGHLFRVRNGLVDRYVQYPTPEEALEAVGLPVET